MTKLSPMFTDPLIQVGSSMGLFLFMGMCRNGIHEPGGEWFPFSSLRRQCVISCHSPHKLTGLAFILSFDRAGD